MVADLSYAIRTLRRSPAFTFSAVLTLALGIGANTAIFSLVNAVLLRPLPYRDADRLVEIVSINRQQTIRQLRTSPVNLLDWRQRTRSFELMGGYFGSGFTFTGDGEPEQVGGQMLTDDVLAALGVNPALGRLLEPRDFEPGNERVLVLSDGFWRRRFGADPTIVGRETTVNGKPYTVVGVMPRDFAFPSKRSQLWAPFPLRPSPDLLLPIARAPGYLQVIARLRPTVSVARAQAEMDAVAAALEQQYPDTNAQLGARVVSLTEQLVGGVRPALMALVGAVSFVLLIACANVTSLLLARATGRTRELAIRAAIGASVWRLVRQMLAESLILYAAGALVAVVAASWALAALTAMSPADVPRLEQASLDARVLAFTALVSLAAGLVFGLLPAWQAARPRLSDTLKSSGRSTGTGGGQRIRSALIVGEVALSLVLLVGAGLAARSFLRLTEVDAGFDVGDQLTFRVVPPANRYADASAILAFHRQLLDALSGAPGIHVVATTTHLPFSGTLLENRFSLEGRAARPSDAAVGALRAVSPGYFAAMGIPIRRGRAFTSDDRRNAPSVAMVTEAFVRRYFEGADPLGRRLGDDDVWRTIVGIAADVKQDGLREEARPAVYVPYEQLDPSTMMTWARASSVVVRGTIAPPALTSVARDRVHALDPLIPLTNLQTIGALASQSVAQPRFRTVLFALFAGLALALAMVGIAGVMSYFVSQRTQEIGIRIALGASRADVLNLVVGRGLGLALTGIALGVAAAVPLMRWRADLLFGVKPSDPATFGAAVAAVTVVAALASYLPARRAARIAPMESLRSE